MATQEEELHDEIQMAQTNLVERSNEIVRYGGTSLLLQTNIALLHIIKLLNHRVGAMEEQIERLRRAMDGRS